MTEQTLKADYADLGVTTGYIGGVGVHGDDRSFRVFVRVAREQYQQMSDLSIEIFSVPYDQRRTWKYDPEIVNYDTPAVRAKLDKMRADVAAGKIFFTVDMLRKMEKQS